MKLGMAMAARTPMISMTTISSTRVKPLSEAADRRAGLFFCLLT
jgi:hypothetical protein